MVAWTKRGYEAARQRDAQIYAFAAGVIAAIGGEMLLVLVWGLVSLLEGRLRTVSTGPTL